MILCGTGHRPDKLGGWSRFNLLLNEIKAEAERRIVARAPTRIISGMALGFDTLLAELALDLGISLTAAVPFQGVERAWPWRSQLTFNKLLERADRVVYVSDPFTKRKLQLRNEWMVEQIGRDGVVLACWDGSEGGTANCYRYAERRGRQIDRIDPNDLRARLASC